jgi:hypothetical protein
MKQRLPLLVLSSLFAASAFLVSCSKEGIQKPVNSEKATGKWSFNAIRMKVYYGGTLYKDSTLPWQPVVENFINFDGSSSVSYCFNSSEVSSGRYTLLPEDLLNMKIDGEDNDWKILLLTPTNFNIVRTVTNHNDFPGATVDIYHCFVR